MPAADPRATNMHLSNMVHHAYIFTRPVMIALGQYVTSVNMLQEYLHERI